MRVAGPRFSRTPRFSGLASLLAVGSIIAVPILVAFFPRWATRLATPLLAITSVGVFLTVPDTERVFLVMTVMVLAAIVSVATPMAPQRGLVAAGAFVVMGAAILDSGGREAAIARAAGCFGVLLAAPIAGWLGELRRGNDERRPPKVMLVIVHCLVVGWSSRALIRETSAAVVLPAVAAALILATLLLFGTSRRVAVQT